MVNISRLLAWWVIGLALFQSAPLSAEAPLTRQERIRRVIVLYGWDTSESEKPRVVPVDTMTAELLQTPIEWLGYECDYVHVAESAKLPDGIEASCAAIIIDGETQVPAAREHSVATCLARAKSLHVPVLFFGGIPFSSDDALRVLRDAFGLRGSLLSTPSATEVTLASASALMNFETKAKPSSHGFHDLQAPADADVHLALTAKSTEGYTLRFTPVFLTTWGGAWLEPYVTLRASQDSQLFYADPWKLTSAFLGKLGPLPVPDTTTRDGCRLFYSHIDGDGFAGLSSFKGHPLCAEIVRDRILKAFPFPVTVSIVEADIRGWSQGIADELQPHIQTTARSIFALPNVQVASHSFSHPYLWHRDDPNPGIYSEPNLPLKDIAKYPDIDIDREIRGSIDYIQRELCPPDKRVELMLWSGNCRPGEQALRICRELGIANMNGGDTVISRLYPGIAGIAPRVTVWGKELQINAANQNEFMYANGWNGPFYGGFAQVTDTFERTETPRRVKPVNVYYHFYSAMNLSSLRALEKIHRWCSEQPLHPITALQFAQTVRDAHQTRVFQQSTRQWTLENEGHLRTYRLAAELGVPDMKACKGITGWTPFQDSIYVHTNGDKHIQLVLTDAIQGAPSAKDAHLRLSSSEAEIEFEHQEPWLTRFATHGHRPARVELAGLPARTRCLVSINDRPQRLNADERGHLVLNLPATALVVVDASEGRHATAAR